MYLPFMNLVRDSKFSSSTRVATTLGITVLIIAYFSRSLTPHSSSSVTNSNNLYELLELDNTSPTAGQLKKAYRDASRKYHPDKNLESDTTEQFIRVKLASDILATPYKKSAYDLTGQTKFDTEDAMEQRMKGQGDMTEEEQ